MQPLIKFRDGLLGVAGDRDKGGAVIEDEKSTAEIPEVTALRNLRRLGPFFQLAEGGQKCSAA